jgi:hypothetical protein
LIASATASYTPRVVFVASAAHAFGTGVDFASLEQPDPAKYNISAAYFQAKSANILTAIELSKRSKGAINAYSLHPGGRMTFLILLLTVLTYMLVIYTNLTQKEESQAELQALGV